MICRAWHGLVWEMTVEKGGLPMAKSILDKALNSQDPIFRPRALQAIAAAGNPDIARWVFTLEDKRLRPTERVAC